MRSTISRVAGLFTFCTCLFIAMPLRAQNLVLNAGFASDLGSWDLFPFFGLTQQWAFDDAGGDINSGSIQGSLPANAPFRILKYASQCIEVQPSTSYAFGGKIFLPASTTPFGAYATVIVDVYSGAHCTVSFTIPGIVAMNVSQVETWTLTGASFVTGPGDQSILLTLRVSAPSGVSLTSNFDDIYLREDDTIFHNGFGG
jgi:hypothetical protein